MWTRKELKTKGKQAFKNNYWKSVAVALISLVVCGGSAGAGNVSNGGDGQQAMAEFQKSLEQASASAGVSVGIIVAILAGIVGAALLVSFLWNIFLSQPIGVGVDRFFMANAKEPAQVGEIGHCFHKGRYLRAVGTVVVMNIFVFLWSLLLVIPGIVKAYEYRMVSYLLADEPQLGTMDCLRRSKEMMKGHKWNAFVLDLSFIGWELLSGLTCGILGVFYVNPYVHATNAELYLTLKEQG